MRRQFTFGLTLLLALAVLFLPPWLALQEAQRQAFDAESSLTLAYAHDVLHRTDETARQALAAGILADVEYQAHPQGYHLWLALRPGLAAADLVDAMRPTGLSVVAGTRFAVTPDAPQAVRVSLGGLIDRLEKSGATFAAKRMHEGSEALRSRDNWFRPVFLAHGPDDALYVADMYRGVIEHPAYLPDEVRKIGRAHV